MHYILFSLLFVCIPLVFTVNHWKLHENGKQATPIVSDVVFLNIICVLHRISFQLQSPYLLQRPGSLLDFIKQGELVKEWTDAVNELHEKLVNFIVFSG